MFSGALLGCTSQTSQIPEKFVPVVSLWFCIIFNLQFCTYDHSERYGPPHSSALLILATFSRQIFDVRIVFTLVSCGIAMFLVDFDSLPSSALSVFLCYSYGFVLISYDFAILLVDLHSVSPPP